MNYIWRLCLCKQCFQWFNAKNKPKKMKKDMQIDVWMVKRPLIFMDFVAIMQYIYGL